MVAMEELVDIYDVNRVFTGKTVPRAGARMAAGEFVLYVLAVVQDAQGRYLVTQRCLEKAWAPGKWEVTGGGVLAGETSAQAVVREVREEVGIDLAGQPLEPFFSYKNVDSESGDNYIVDMYKFQLDVTKADVVLQESEAIDCAFVTWDDICALAEAGEFLHFERLRTALGK